MTLTDQKEKKKRRFNACFHWSKSKANQNSAKCNIILTVFCFFWSPCPSKALSAFLFVFLVKSLFVQWTCAACHITPLLTGLTGSQSHTMQNHLWTCSSLSTRFHARGRLCSRGKSVYAVDVTWSCIFMKTVLNKPCTVSEWKTLVASDFYCKEHSWEPFEHTLGPAVVGCLLVVLRATGRFSLLYEVMLVHVCTFS